MVPAPVPAPRARRCGITAWDIWKLPRRLVSTTSSYSARVMSSMRVPWTTPALPISTSIRPKLTATCSTVARQAAPSRTSQT